MFWLIAQHGRNFWQYYGLGIERCVGAFSFRIKLARKQTTITQRKILKLSSTNYYLPSIVKLVPQDKHTNTSHYVSRS